MLKDLWNEFAILYIIGELLKILNHKTFVDILYLIKK